MLLEGNVHDQQEVEGIVSKAEGVSVSVTIHNESHLEMMTQPKVKV